MAIQDDNTILNKGDLKAYHEKIAPMLGGTFMVSTNNSDYYSTDEKVVGVWTNGKPVYQKAINVSSVVLPSNQWIDTSISFTCETIVYSKAVWVSRQPSGSVAYQGQSIDVRCTSAGKLSLYTPYGNVNPDYIIVQYTKTTDAAGSAVTTPGAYDINFPNTWPANTEIYFGNGLYGYRATGSTAITSGTVKSWDAVSITRTANTRIYNYGGTWKRSSAIPAAADTVFGMALSDDHNINTGVMIGSQAIIFTVKDAFTGTATYDFFVTYTK